MRAPVRQRSPDALDPDQRTDNEARMVALWLLERPEAGTEVARLPPDRRRLVLAEVGNPPSWITMVGL